MMMAGAQVAEALDARPGGSVRKSFAIWAVKTSFYRYIAGLADGACAVSGDVRLVDGGQYLLPGQVSGSEHELVWSSPASLRFTGHGGMLWIELREPRLELGPESGSLFITAADGRLRPIRLARAAIAERFESALRVDLRLTAEGAALFGGNYLPGEPLDPIRLVIEPLP